MHVRSDPGMVLLVVVVLLLEVVAVELVVDVVETETVLVVWAGVTVTSRWSGVGASHAPPNCRQPYTARPGSDNVVSQRHASVGVDGSGGGGGRLPCGRSAQAQSRPLSSTPFRSRRKRPTWPAESWLGPTRSSRGSVVLVVVLDVVVVGARLVDVELLVVVLVLVVGMVLVVETGPATAVTRRLAEPARAAWSSTVAVSV